VVVSVGGVSVGGVSVGGVAQFSGAVVLACGRDAGEAGGVEEEKEEVVLHVNP